MTTKEALRRIIETLSDEEAQDLLDYLNTHADPDTLSEEEARLLEQAQQAIAHGDYVRDESLDQLRREIDQSE